MTIAVVPPSVSAPAFLDLYDALLEQNVKISSSSLGFNREELLNLEMRIPASMQTMLWEIAKKQGAPDHIGLIVGQKINKDAQGMLSHLIYCAEDLHEALSLYERFLPAMSENERVEIKSTSIGCRIQFYGEADPERCLSNIERSVSSVLTWGRHLTGEKITPVRVGFRHKRPDYAAEYIKTFGQQVMFEQPMDFIEIDQLTLSRAVKTANPYVKDVLTHHVDKFVKGLKKNNSLCSKVKILLCESLYMGDESSTLIADKLNMSRQTLHRKLKRYGVNYRALLEEVRKEKAVEYLCDDGLTLDDVSGRLGFKEPSSFYRAFKSWFDESPGNYRKGLTPANLESQFLAGRQLSAQSR